MLERRAFVRLPPAAKVALCHRSGAPWNDKDPKARLSDMQIEALSRPEREKIVHGGSGLGKSVTCAAELLCAVLLPYQNVALGASRYDHVASEFQYVYKGLRELFKGRLSVFIRLVFKNQPNYHEYDVQTCWGTRLIGVSTDSDEGAVFLGKSFDFVGLGEGSHISPDILEKKILRALDRAMSGSPIETGYLAIYTTPKGYDGCSASEWERVLKQTNHKPELLHYGKVPFAESVWLREAAVIENPAYSKDAYEARKKSLDKNAFEEQYLGKMTWKTGIVFKELEQARHVRPTPKSDVIRKMQLGFGIDTGTYFGGVLYGMYEPVERVRHRWVLGEVYTAQATITESLAQVRDLICRVLGPVFGLDEAREETFDLLKQRVSFVIDPASQHKLEVTEALDVALYYPKLLLEPTIDNVRDWLRRDELFLADMETETLLDQMRKYVWKFTRQSVNRANGVSRTPIIQEPKKGYDHLIDAFRLVSHAIEDMGTAQQEPELMTIAQQWQTKRKQIVFGPLRDLMERAENRGGIAC